jgi:hypothetical protein|tara:strand:- start:268 stop:429 length:162 start_codon:yes stop_codon:yes gene_type:complete
MMENTGRYNVIRAEYEGEFPSDLPQIDVFSDINANMIELVEEPPTITGTSEEV